jgi:MarR family transcriptional regulator, transcriptional regulator for hemolysin
MSQTNNPSYNNLEHNAKWEVARLAQIETEKRSKRPRKPPPERPGLSFEEAIAELRVESALSWLFVDIHRLLGQKFSLLMTSGGLTRAQWRILFTTRKFHGDTQTALAERLDMERAPLGKALDRLEALGWIERRPDPADRRIRRVYCLDKISRYLPEAVEVSKEVFAGALSGMKPSEVEALIAQLTQIKTNLGGQD